MSWTLVERRGASPDVARFAFRSGMTAYLTFAETRDSVSITNSLTAADQKLAVARITITAWSFKLEALNSLVIRPAQPRTSTLIEPHQEEYALNGSSNGPEIIYLRDDDTILFPGAVADISLTVEYDPSEVQVNSSVTGDAEIPESEDHGLADPETSKQNDNDDPSETEDEAMDSIMTASVTDVKKPTFQATPAASASRSEIIQETPTMDRSFAPAGISASEQQRKTSGAAKDEPEDTVMTGIDFTALRASQNGAAPNSSQRTVKSGEDGNGHVSSIKDPLEATNGDIGTISTKSKQAARNHPKVQVTPSKGSLKRKSKLVAGEDEPSSESMPLRSSKRNKTTETTPEKLKVEDDVADQGEKTQPQGKLSSVSKRGKKAPTSPADLKDRPDTETGPSPAASTRKSVASELLYQGPPPMVAFSNTTILETLPQTAKYFHRLRCTKVETVEEGQCDLLCVQEGPLKRSIKLLLCIALGIPIVTDRWLQDCAKKDCLLDPKPYMPKVPDQEGEWGFSFDRVWGKPQRGIFKDLILHFTKSARDSYQSFDDVKEICTKVGCEETPSSLRPKAYSPDNKNIVCVGLEEDDDACARLLKQGYTVFNKDFFTCSILRGEANLDSDEFKIKTSPSQATTPNQAKTPGTQRKEPSSQRKEPQKKGRPRKS